MKQNNGFVTILILIILSALTLTMVMSFFEIGYQASRSGLEAEIGVKARAYADSCAEKALYYFSQSVDIATIEDMGRYEFPNSNSFCDIVGIEEEIVNPTSTHFLLKVEGNVNNGQAIRRVEVYLKTNDSGASYQYKWSEVNNFNSLVKYSI